MELEKFKVRICDFPVLEEIPEKNFFDQNDDHEIFIDAMEIVLDYRTKIIPYDKFKARLQEHFLIPKTSNSADDKMAVERILALEELYDNQREEIYDTIATRRAVRWLRN